MKTKIIWYTSRVYDLFHIGHLNILRNAKSMCEELIVAVATDEYTFLAKWKYPIIPYNDRVQIIESINVVDSVIPHDADSFEDSAFVDYTLKKQKELKFDIIFKGSDA